MELENFSGTQAEAVKQDFYATVYLSGLALILTDAAQAQLDAKHTKYPQTVNRAEPCRVIQYQALDLLFGRTLNPCLARKHRHPPRKKSSARMLLSFQKRQKKHCF